MKGAHLLTRHDILDMFTQPQIDALYDKDYDAFLECTIGDSEVTRKDFFVLAETLDSDEV